MNLKRGQSSGFLMLGGFAAGIVCAILGWGIYDRALRPLPTGAITPAASGQQALEERVRAVLLENPELLVEAARRFQARQQMAARRSTEAAVAANADEIFRDPMSPVGGNPDGDVTLVEFFDYNCPYCRAVNPVMGEAERADPQLRIVYKEFPVLGPDSVFAARAALAAARQDRKLYISLHDALMRTKQKVTPALALTLAAEVGLDVERLKADMEDPAIHASIDRNLALAKALGIKGTPSFVIGNHVVRGAVDVRTLRTLIRQARVDG